MDEITVYAPVMIPTLNRYNHLKNCVESLANCTGADKTELYISVDYPPSDKYRVGYKEVLDYVGSGIKGFKQVHIFIQKHNLGVANFKFLREQIASKHDRIILTEDDNVFSPNFLEYVNKGLEKYKDNDRIWGICAYNYPIDMPQSYCDKYNYYYSHEYSAWGVGYFIDRFNASQDIRNVDYGRKILKRYWRKITWSARAMLVESLDNKKFIGDLYRTLYLIEKDMYCVFPTENLVVNKGHDGSGVNCGNMVKDIYSIQHHSKELYFNFHDNPPLRENKAIRKELNKYFDIPFRSKIKYFIYSLKYRFF